MALAALTLLTAAPAAGQQPAVDSAMDAEPANPISASRIEELETRIGELELALSDLQTAQAKPDAKSDDSFFTKIGENGFEVESHNGDFYFHAGGRVQVDGVALQAPNLVLGGAGDDDSASLRRARLRFDGRFYETMLWAAEFDVANTIDTDPLNPANPVDPYGGDVINVAAPTDVWWLFTELPLVNNLRIGIQKEPMGLERLTSSRFLDFMERSYLQDAFNGPRNNGFSPGIAFLNWNESETVTWSLGGFKVTQNPFGYEIGDNEYAVTGRLTCVPLSGDGDRELLHLAIAGSYRGLDEEADPTVGNLRIRSRASLRNGPGPFNPSLADTNFSGRLYGDTETFVSPEAAIILGPWHFQSEYVAGYVNDTTFTPIASAPVDVGRVFFNGGYVQALYFLTGEHREYDRHGAKFERVVPRDNFDVTRDKGWCGLGAWQIGARYGYLDLNNGPIDGGYVHDLTLGLNWFINPNAKMQFNYIIEDVSNNVRNGAGVITAVNDDILTGFGVRMAFDF